MPCTSFTTALAQQAKRHFRENLQDSVPHSLNRRHPSYTNPAVCNRAPRQCSRPALRFRSRSRCGAVPGRTVKIC